MNADVILAEQANAAVIVLHALALTYPDGHPDRTILQAAATIAGKRVAVLLDDPVDAPATLRLVGGEGGT